MNELGTQKPFVYVWEYIVKKERKRDFERIYGSNGKWVHLFEKGVGYLGTELHRDISNNMRYVTVDYWVSKEAKDTFREQYAQEFAKLDQSCESLTERESFLGDFESLGTQR